MLITRQSIIAAATAFEGVKYMHQHCDRRSGMDCIGLLRATAKSVNYAIVESFVAPAYRMKPDPVMFLGLLRDYFDEIKPVDARPADILCMDYGFGIQHVGILLPGNKLVHSEREFKRVAIHDIDAKWQRKIDLADTAFKWRGIEEA